MSAAGGVHVDLDGAWPHLPLPRVDVREWGPKLRFSAPPKLIAAFRDKILPELSPFVVVGSGDFHHLSGVWLQRFHEPFVLVSFDNHPDWDVRPPRWGCGGWINRALELSAVHRVEVWGCGNFECWWPGRIWRNRLATGSGRLRVHAWAEGRPARDQQNRIAILRANWREKFQVFADGIAGANLYITIDLDCLAPEFACTNWENGTFTLDDLVWALARLRAKANVIGGDLCGAYSPPTYARRKQRFASEMDHPKIALPPADQIAAINLAAFAALWPRLTE